MSGSARQRRPGRLHLRRRRREDDYIWTYQFPEHVEARCRDRHPDLTDREWQLVEQGLREWFLSCVGHDGAAPGMPSPLVAEACHLFTLDSSAYADFCDRAFGESLHQAPEASTATPMAEAPDSGAHHHGSAGEPEPAGEAEPAGAASEAGGGDSGGGSDSGGGGDSGGDSGGGD
jgi:hypothetical protein